MNVRDLVKRLNTFDMSLPVAIPACDYSGCDTCGFHEEYFKSVHKLIVVKADELGYGGEVEKVDHLELRTEK